ncbi:hypothetical protein BS333_15210 [Vibrio azureus]|uniref:Uncharacterized protein n=1 Tax=Vibrio azureus NBRC 104587 TaxID=1219077 RepID=U3ATM9_9VIBR|nr:hypothetical protein [Vibrio azureus]AUI87749.1 hypothetical protein BS333_15210 [Vibrio azureus]GAD76597.1 hypothetical protein VAZ01S_048_00030 [Vibrio azureus NBRC 104587]
MDTTQKLFNLVPNHWQDVLVQAHKFEGYIDKAETFVDEQKIALEAHVSELFNFLDIDWEKLSTWLLQNPILTKFSAVNIDIPAFIALPDGFDGNDTAQMQALVKEKLELLKQAFAPVEFEQMNLDELFPQLETIIQTLVDLPEDLDFDDPLAVNEYKNSVIDSLRPQIYALVSSLFDLDLKDSMLNSTLTRTQTLTDDFAQKLTQSPQSPPMQSTQEGQDVDFTDELPLQEEPQEGVIDPDLGTLFEQNPVQGIIAFVDKLKTLLPAIANQFQGQSIAGFEVATLITIAEELLTLIADNLAELVNKIVETDWQNLNLDGFVAEVQSIKAFVIEKITQSPLGGLYLAINWPSSSLGYVESTPEQAYEMLKEVIAVPQELESWGELQSLTLPQLSEIARTKLTSAFELLRHLSPFGLSPAGLIDKVSEPMDALLSVANDHDFDDLSANVRLVIGKLTYLIERFFPNLTGSLELPDEHDFNDLKANGRLLLEKIMDMADKLIPEQDRSLDAGLKPLGELPLSSLLYFVVEQLKKGQLIYDFIQQQDIKIELVDQTQPAATGQKVVVEAQIGQEEKETTQTTNPTQPNQTQAANQQNTADTEAEKPDTDNNNAQDPNFDNATDTQADPLSQTNSALLTNQQWLMAILGNKQTGLISQIENQAEQDFILNLLSGTLVDQAVNTFLAWPEVASLKNNALSGFDELLKQLSLHPDQTDTAPLTLGSLVTFSVEAVEAVYKALLSLLEKSIITAIELLHRTLSLCFSLLRSAQVPEGMLPQFFEQRFVPVIEYTTDSDADDGSALIQYTDSTPNILCLMLALPVSTISKLLTLPLEELQEWMGEVT